jgi:hypothetical protein
MGWNGILIAERMMDANHFLVGKALGKGKREKQQYIKYPIEYTCGSLRWGTPKDND